MRPLGFTDLTNCTSGTGQKRDGAGLLYMNARYYDPQLGAFISPDTIVPDAGLVIDYNRYAYSRANPLKYNDPTGHFVNLAAAGAGFALGFVGSVGLQAGKIALQQWQNGDPLSVGLDDIDLGQALGSGAAGAITGFTMGAGAGLIASGYSLTAAGTVVTAAGFGGIGNALGGQASAVVEATYDVIKEQGKFNQFNIVAKARENGLGSSSQLAVDASVGIVLGGLGAAANQVLPGALSQLGLRNSRIFNPRYEPTIGGILPRDAVIEKEVGQGAYFAGSVLIRGVDLLLELASAGSAEVGCQALGCE